MVLYKKCCQEVFVEGEQRNEKMEGNGMFKKKCIRELFWVIIMRIEKFIYLENKQKLKVC